MLERKRVPSATSSLVDGEVRADRAAAHNVILVVVEDVGSELLQTGQASIIKSPLGACGLHSETSDGCDRQSGDQDDEGEFHG